MKRALIAVNDKTGVTEFAKGLTALGFEIISTGNTKKVLSDAGIAAVSIEDVTGFPECLDGRLKTLHPNVHGGILAKRNDKSHMEHLSTYKINTIDLVCVNLYNFKEAAENNASIEGAIEKIDIGGPSMLRSAAKNFEDVIVVCDPLDYAIIVDTIKSNGNLSYEERFRLSQKAFALTASYDALISGYFYKKLTPTPENYADRLTLTFEKAEDMRYGENPHQKAAFYKEAGTGNGRVSDYKQLHGKQMSFNNINDLNGAVALLKEFDGEQPAVVAVKHTTPCGVGVADSLFDAYIKAHNADPESIFGGIVALNKEVDEATATEMAKIFLEVIAAPSFSEKALTILCEKKNIRLITIEDITAREPNDTNDMKKVSGGLLVQNVNNALLNESDLEVPTKRKPTEEEMRDLIFSYKIVKHMRSNAISIGKNGASVGLGGGQVRRSWACGQAIEHGVEIYGADYLKGAVMASDGFFPFTDCVEMAAKAGITAIIQPGGSKNDDASVAECDKYGIAMVYAGIRQFKH